MGLIKEHGWRLVYLLPLNGLVYFGLGLVWVCLALAVSREHANHFWHTVQ